MKDKDLPLDNNSLSLEELTNQVKKKIETLENERDISNSIESYQELLRLNKAIEKKFYENFKNISEKTKNIVKDISKKNEKYA